MNQETDISRYLHMIDVCKTVAKLDKEWQRGDVGHDDARYTPWMPNPSWPDYVALLAEAMPDVEGPRFLEVGCGIGTRMLIAREMFGLDVSGIERVPEYVAQAKELGLSVECIDALGWEGYGTFDVVWLNRPFRDPEMELALEGQIWAEVEPGTVVLCANLQDRPPTWWWPVFEDVDIRRWIVQKPRVAD